MLYQVFLPNSVAARLVPSDLSAGQSLNLKMADRTRPIVRLDVTNRMVTKGYRKGVYERVTKGTNRFGGACLGEATCRIASQQALTCGAYDSSGRQRETLAAQHRPFINTRRSASVTIGSNMNVLWGGR